MGSIFVRGSRGPPAGRTTQMSEDKPNNLSGALAHYLPPTADSQRDMVAWLREASPYVHAHRGQTFVVYLSGAAVEAEQFARHVYDLALLISLGVRLVVVHGIRPQLSRRLAQSGIDSEVVNGIRITGPEVLPCVIDACGRVRARLEAHLSQAVTTSPMAGAALRVAGGTFVTARPLGVVRGRDFGHTGEVRRIDREGITRRLAEGDLVLLSPLAYSASGETWNLDASTLAAEVAVELGAAKLLLLSENGPVCDQAGEPVREITLRDAESAPSNVPEEAARMFERALRACRRGVPRVHLIDHQTDGALLLELYSRDGVGTLISNNPFDRIRRAGIDDVSAIIGVIAPFEAAGLLVRRPRDLIEREIERFFVATRDEQVVACAALHPFEQSAVAELACIAVDPRYAGRGFGSELLKALEHTAARAGAESVFVLTTGTADWFRQHGFVPAELSDLPVLRQQIHNQQRNSLVLSKRLR